MLSGKDFLRNVDKRDFKTKTIPCRCIFFLKVKYKKFSGFGVNVFGCVFFC